MVEIKVHTRDAIYTLDARVPWARFQAIFPQDIRQTLINNARSRILLVDFNKLAAESLTDHDFRVLVQISSREISVPVDFHDKFQAFMFFAHLLALSEDGILNLEETL